MHRLHCCCTAVLHTKKSMYLPCHVKNSKRLFLFAKNSDKIGSHTFLFDTTLQRR